MKNQETRVIFLHGLESPAVSDKSKWLEKNYSGYCPAMDYRDPNAFQEIYNETLKRLELIKNKGYNIITIWESDYKNKK